MFLSIAKETNLIKTLTFFITGTVPRQVPPMPSQEFEMVDLELESSSNHPEEPQQDNNSKIYYFSNVFRF